MPWIEATSPGKVAYEFKTVVAALSRRLHGEGLEAELREDIAHPVRPSDRGDATWEAAAGVSHGSTSSAAAVAAARPPAADAVWDTLREGAQMYDVGADGRAARGACGPGDSDDDDAVNDAEEGGEEEELLPRSERHRATPRRRATHVFLDRVLRESNASLLRWWLIPCACVASAIAACALFVLFRAAKRAHRPPLFVLGKLIRAIEAEAGLRSPSRNGAAPYPRTCGGDTTLPARFSAAVTRRDETGHAPPSAGSDASLRGGGAAARNSDDSDAQQRFNVETCQYAALDIWRTLASAQNVTRWAAAGGALVGAECFASMNPWNTGIDLHVAWANAGALAGIWDRAEVVPKWTGVGGKAWDARAVSVEKGPAALLLKSAGGERVMYRLYALPLSSSSPSEGEGGVTLSLGAWQKEAYYQRKSGYLAFMKGADAIRELPFGPTTINAVPRTIAAEYMKLRGWSCA